MPKPSLSDAAARALAQRLWGATGHAWHPASEFRGGLCWCTVGVTGGRSGEHQWTVYGIGETWEQAFADAQARGH